MASIYRKTNSPFWFFQLIDFEGKRRNRSTGLRADNPGQTVKARALRAQMEAKAFPKNDGAQGTITHPSPDLRPPFPIHPPQ